jgi:hypothetical protein
MRFLKAPVPYRGKIYKYISYSSIQLVGSSPCWLDPVSSWDYKALEVFKSLTMKRLVEDF